MEQIIASLTFASEATNMMQAIVGLTQAQELHNANRFHGEVRKAIDIALHTTRNNENMNVVMQYTNDALETAINCWELYKAGKLN